MKRIVSIGFLLLFVCNVFMFALIRFNYEVNKERITELFCINKDKPMTMCYGKCFLKDEMEKAKKEKEDRSFVVDQIPLTFAPNIDLSLDIPVTDASHINLSFYSNLYHFTGDDAIFHPPQTICII